MDFVHDRLVTGRGIRVRTIVDTFSRFSPATDPRFNYRGEDVVRTLERVCGETGYPKAIRVDQGSEFISRDLDLWAYQKGVVLDFSRPAARQRVAWRTERGGKAGRQRLHRKPQRQIQGGVPERASPLSLGPMALQRQLHEP